MTRNSGKRCVLQNRDRDILRYIKECRTLNIEQLKKRFWNNGSAPLAIRRMKKLIEQGLATQVKMELLRVSTYYYLTKKGFKMLVDCGLTFDNERPFLPEPTDIIRADFQHNLRVADIRIALETDQSLRIHNWITDTVLKADKEAYGLEKGKKDGVKGIRINPKKEKEFKYRIPDAVFELEDADSKAKIILEYEHSQYKRWKFRAYISNWEEKWADYQKLIVASTPERAKVLEIWCVEDLKERYKVDISRGQADLEELANAYLFTDYHSIIKKGFIHSGLKTPFSKLSLKPLK